MKLILLLLAALVAGAIIYPRYAEGTDTVCAAFEHKLNALAQTQLRQGAGALPGGLAADPRLGGILSSLQAAVSASRGMLAEAFIREKYPQLPPLAGCVAGYWDITFNPDLSRYVPGGLKLPH